MGGVPHTPYFPLKRGWFVLQCGQTIGPSGCVRCRGSKVSTINGVIFSSIFSLSSLRQVTFLPEGVIVGFQNFAWGFNSQKKIRFGAKIYVGDPSCPRGGRFFRVFVGEKKENALNTKKSLAR